jgi:hypothetical protein
VDLKQGERKKWNEEPRTEKEQGLNKMKAKKKRKINEE